MDIFLPFLASIEDWMLTWTNDNQPNSPHGMPTFPERKGVILVTHKDSTFYANYWCKTQWVHATEIPEQLRKGEGTSVMVSHSAHQIQDG